MEADIFLDESGDMGWNFTQRYRFGGSSRYLTIAYLIIPKASSHLPARLVRDCFDRWDRNPKNEMKGSKMSNGRRTEVIEKTVKLLGKVPDAHIGAITVKKENVEPHIRKDPNKLYNYMIGVGLLDQIKSYTKVNLIRDNRSMKVEDGNTIGHYLQMELWFRLGVKTELIDTPTDSKHCLQLQMIDWISYMVWSAFEDNKVAHMNHIRPYCSFKSLFV